MNTLFSQPDSFAQRGTGMLAEAADSVMPINTAQRRDLAHACRDLSALLTTERRGLSRSYWASPRLTSAYLRYFLPWNIVRLTALLPQLPLGRIPDEPLILDIGSGPLTVPIALWLSCPDLRRRKATIVASDTSPHILELGRAMLGFLRAKLDPESPWTVRTMRSPSSLALRRLHASPGDVWLVTMANVLNEMDERKPRQGMQLADRLRELLEDAFAMLREDGHILSIEPGTRQGGRLIAMLRDCALGGTGGDGESSLMDLALRELEGWQDAGGPEEDGEEDDPLFTPVSPCPHAGPCPMLGRHSSAWCHFNAPAPQAPQFLRELSARAGMDKESVSLSFLLLKKGAPAREHLQARGRTVPARIVSDAFSVPGLSGAARYACTPRGLALIPNALRMEQGSLHRVSPSRERDRKSGATLMLPEAHSPAPVQGQRKRQDAASRRSRRHENENAGGKRRDPRSR